MHIVTSKSKQYSYILLLSFISNSQKYDIIYKGIDLFLYSIKRNNFIYSIVNLY